MPPPPSPTPAELELTEHRASLLLGCAVELSDAELVAMLRRRPKAVPELNTRSNFRRFFTGMPRLRMQHLLEESFGDDAAGSARSIGGEEACEEEPAANAAAPVAPAVASMSLGARDRIARRLALIVDVLV